MAPRKPRRWLGILGGILIAAGLFAILTGTSGSGAQDTAPIAPNPAGTEYFAEYSWSVLAGGTLRGTFHVLDNTPITVFLFNDADYNAYVNGQNETGLYTVTASNGTIDAAVPGWNTYHLVFQHSAGFESQEQDVAVDLTTTGIDPGYFLGGLAAAILGIGLIAYGVVRARHSAARAPSGILDSRATYLPPPVPPSSPDASTSSGGLYQVPPPLPGTPEGEAAAQAPTGNVVLTLDNRSSGEETVSLAVNGAPLTTVRLGPGTSQVVTVTARLASPFGSMVAIQAVTSGGRRYEQSVFVGARGTAPLTLRIG